MPNLLDGWRTRRARKRTEEDARQLVSETRRVLRKKGQAMPEAVKAELDAAMTAVEAVIQRPDLEPLRQALSALDEKMDQHLAFARKSTTREYVESVAVAVGIALFLRAFVIEAFQIPSGSMIPTLEVGDHIFVAKFSYGIGIPFTNAKILKLAQPRRGDVIVFKYPRDPETDYIKRVVGLPGDKLEIRRNEVFINGRPMPRELAAGDCRYADGPILEGGYGERPCELWIENLDGKTHELIQEPNRLPTDREASIVPDGTVFVMGDNRDNSNDSRFWGTVPMDLIKGRALVVWWSRGPIDGDVSIAGFKKWFKAVRWGRFFHVVR